MTKGRFALFLCALVIASGFGGTSPKAAAEDDCTGSPFDAVTSIPSPLRKWAHIDCTPFGHVLASRDGWTWAWLDGSGTVFVPSQMVEKDPDRLGNESYFTRIKVSELDAEESAGALEYFQDALEATEAMPHGYRAALTSVSGMNMTLYFFDFGDFAWGLWCPDDDCLPDSRFVVMQKDQKALLRKASI
jgi:hypothetical protein